MARARVDKFGEQAPDGKRGRLSHVRSFNPCSLIQQSLHIVYKKHARYW